MRGKCWSFALRTSSEQEATSSYLLLAVLASNPIATASNLVASHLGRPRNLLDLSWVRVLPVKLPVTVSKQEPYFEQGQDTNHHPLGPG